ncbi:phosphotransferase [Gemmata sp. G18]|uniref:Phosphotransferase n=1 Tax=Gemmata palustris TaxID=2822762 RepID=A0ABS5BJH7_9BACT|nr:phosphotransferase [Gemmata palustris]MBP3953856.1 phosphotransferase [Gemmata palustris]
MTSDLAWHRATEGFSGAVVWRGDDSTNTPRVALKGWPIGVSAERVRQIHLWMSRAAHLPFVPAVFTGTHGSTAVFADGRFWDACRWVPGEPRALLTETEVCAACDAIAQLHLCWPLAPARGPCRGVLNRIEVLTEHRARFDDWNRVLPAVAPELDSLLRRAVKVVRRCADPAISALRPWSARPLVSRPVLRDLRSEHVLFTADRVTGIIDFGAMAIDHPAIDLARFLGESSSARDAIFSAGLSAYRSAAVLDAPDEFVHLLARTGIVCSVLGWLVRLVVRREPVPRPTATAARLTHLLTRAEEITHF